MAHILLARGVLQRQPLILTSASRHRFRSNRAQPPPLPPSEPPGTEGESQGGAASQATASSPPSPSVPPSSGPSGLPTLDFAPRPETETQNARTGARSAKGSLSTIERRRRFMGRFALGAFAVGVGFGIVHLGRPWERDELNGRQAVEEVSMVCFSFVAV